MRWATTRADPLGSRRFAPRGRRLDGELVVRQQAQFPREPASSVLVVSINTPRLLASCVTAMPSRSAPLDGHPDLVALVRPTCHWPGRIARASRRRRAARATMNAQRGAPSWLDLAFQLATPACWRSRSHPQPALERDGGYRQHNGGPRDGSAALQAGRRRRQRRTRPAVRPPAEPKSRAGRATSLGSAPRARASRRSVSPSPRRSAGAHQLTPPPSDRAGHQNGFEPSSIVTIR
jgi:hypothetical protein